DLPGHRVHAVREPAGHRHGEHVVSLAQPGDAEPEPVPARTASVTGVQARLTGSLNVSVIAVGDAGTAVPSAGEVNRSVACADAPGAATASRMPAAATIAAS